MPEHGWRTVGDSWVYWNNDLTYSTSVTSGTWTTWVSTATSGTSATTPTYIVNDQVWHAWATYQQPTRIVVQGQAAQPSAAELERQREEFAARAEEIRLRDEARRKEALEARARARELLLSCLTEEEAASLRANNYFDLRSIAPDGQERTYRIQQGSHGNVYELDEQGNRVRRFCVQPEGIPTEDQMLAQYLFLKANPAEFHAKANATDLRTTPRAARAG